MEIAEILSHFFRESNCFTKEITKYVVDLTKKNLVRENSRFSTLCVIAFYSTFSTLCTAKKKFVLSRNFTVMLCTILHKLCKNSLRLRVCLKALLSINWFDEKKCVYNTQCMRFWEWFHEKIRQIMLNVDVS